MKIVIIRHDLLSVQVWALVGSAFTKQVDVVSVAPPSEDSQNHMASYLQTPRTEEQPMELSVLSRFVIGSLSFMYNQAFIWKHS
jgi:hypothetical protein